MNAWLPMNLMWLLNGIDAKPFPGKQGFCCVVLQSGIESAPINHSWFGMSIALDNRWFNGTGCSNTSYRTPQLIVSVGRTRHSSLMYAFQALLRKLTSLRSAS